jgi:hypothetical protein
MRIDRCEGPRRKENRPVSPDGAKGNRAGVVFDALLENVLYPELNDARGGGSRRDDTEGRRGAGVHAEWRIKLRVIKKIEKLGAELQRAVLPNLSGLQQGHIKVELAGARNNADARISETTASTRERGSG